MDEFYTNFNQMDIYKSTSTCRISPCTSDSSNNSCPAKPRHEVNARERCRTQSGSPTINSVNSAFNTLRTLIPTEPENRKLSKIEILRLAQSYINHLDAIIVTGSAEKPCMLHSYLNDRTAATTTRSSICTFCANAVNQKT